MNPLNEIAMQGPFSFSESEPNMLVNHDGWNVGEINEECKEDVLNALNTIFGIKYEDLFSYNTLVGEVEGKKVFIRDLRVDFQKALFDNMPLRNIVESTFQLLRNQASLDLSIIPEKDLRLHLANSQAKFLAHLELCKALVYDK